MQRYNNSLGIHDHHSSTAVALHGDQKRDLISSDPLAKSSAPSDWAGQRQHTAQDLEAIRIKDKVPIYE